MQFWLDELHIKLTVKIVSVGEKTGPKAVFGRAKRPDARSFFASAIANKP